MGGKTYDYVIASRSLKGNISQTKVVEDFESRPFRAVSFAVEREEETQECNEQKLPKALPGYSGRTGKEGDEEAKRGRCSSIRSMRMGKKGSAR